VWCGSAKSSENGNDKKQAITVGGLWNSKLTSPAFIHGLQIPSKYTCDGENINPHLPVRGVPAGERKPGGWLDLEAEII
jgi:phosphatidylethanolamine-binding protein (PEBP) family uncharacterized protein